MHDNYNKKNKPKSTSISIDGLSRPDNPHKPMSRGSIDFQRSSTGPQAKRAAIDNFNRPEGYRASVNTDLGTAVNATVASRPVKPRKKLFRPGRRKAERSLDGTLHSRHRRKLSGRKKALRIFVGLLLIVLMIGGFLFAKGYINFHKVFRGGGGAAALQENVDPTKLNGEGDGRVNILVLGRAGDGHPGADLTDTIILASIDPISKEAALVSVPRDLYVRVSGYGSMKINAAFAAGKNDVLNNSAKITSDVRKKAEDAGFKTVEDTVQSVLGLPIHYHAMIDFAGFEKAIDTVGGIDFNAPKPVVETLRIDGRNYRLDVQPGQQHFDGFKALAYARSRYTSPRGDFDRSERQRLIIVALKEKILSAGTYSNPAKISQLFDAFGAHVQTNFSTADAKRLYDISKEIGGGKINSIGLVDAPNDFLTTSNIGGLSVVVPKAGVNNYKAIQSYLRNTLKDSFLKDENASIMVLNGTSKPGLATTEAEELKSFGYNITKIDNAPTSTYARTIVVDLRSGAKKYTKHYLEQRFKSAAVTSLPDSQIQPLTADFVIIIGNDQLN